MTILHGKEVRNASPRCNQNKAEYDLHAAGTRSRTNITAGSDIAATYDGFSTDYIFYQDANDQLIRALYYGQQITDLEEIAVIKADSKLSATYGSSHSNDGAMVFYQNATNTKAISYETVNRSGDKLLSGTVE